MTGAAQGHLGFETEWDPDAVAGTDSDSYCTPPEVMAPVHEVAGEITLDPWTNRYAISHGWVRARTAWTLEDGHHPDPTIDPDPWPIDRESFVWGNPPYSDPGPYLIRMAAEIERAGCWGMALVKLDSRTRWWAAAADQISHLIAWRGPVSFYLAGQLKRGNNFASAIMVFDPTDQHVSPHDLHQAFELPKLAWVYR